MGCNISNIRTVTKEFFKILITKVEYHKGELIMIHSCDYWLGLMSWSSILSASYQYAASRLTNIQYPGN